MRLILFLLAAGGCVPIDGGAVEASWVLRAEDGRAINDCGCADPAIVHVRVSLLGDGGEVKGTEPCKGRWQCGFPCGNRGGATPFDIPPGPYLVWLTPADAQGNDLSIGPDDMSRGPDDMLRRRVEVPAPVLREVVRGQPMQLEAYQLVARCAADCAGARDNKVCK